jgi:hypothetical protein
VTSLGTVSSCSRQFGVVSGCSWQSLDCYHTQILYGYGLTQYVVETSLGIPIGGEDRVVAQSV